MGQGLKKLKIKSNARKNIIFYLYKMILLNQEINSDQAFETEDFNDYELKIIEKISKNWDKLIKIAETHLISTWKWSRLDALEKSILIYGAFEMQINQKAIVINELINFTREYIPGEKYKYINSILDKIGRDYEIIKNR